MTIKLKFEAILVCLTNIVFLNCIVFIFELSNVVLFLTTKLDVRKGRDTLILPQIRQLIKIEYLYKKLLKNVFK